jgi:gamma-glutamyl phosphate reductase
MRGRGMWGAGFGGMCNPRFAGLAEWRVDQIERAVKLTEAQQAALKELRAASAKAAEGLAAACPKDLPKTSGERLAFMEKRLEAMLQAVKSLRPAFDAFYASLNEGQKASLDDADPRRWGGQRWRDR